jgi:hypothetical protein
VPTALCGSNHSAGCEISVIAVTLDAFIPMNNSIRARLVPAGNMRFYAGFGGGERLSDRAYHTKQDEILTAKAVFNAKKLIFTADLLWTGFITAI